MPSPDPARHEPDPPAAPEPALAATDPDDDALLAAHADALGLDGDALARLRANPDAAGRAASVRRALAARLHECVAKDEPFPDPIRHAYGVASPLHDRVLREAVRAGRFPVGSAALAAFRSDAIDAALTSTPASVPLHFPTTVGTRPSVRSSLPAGLAVEGQVTVSTPGLPLHFVVGNDIELWRATTLRTKEPDTIAWLDTTMHDHAVLIDIGASTGLYSLYAAATHPGARAVAVEPNPFSLARLLANVAANQLSDRVLPCGIALTSPGPDDDPTSGVRVMHLRSDAAGAATPDQIDHAEHAVPADGAPADPADGAPADTAPPAAGPRLLIAPTTLDAVVAAVVSTAGPDWAPTHIKIDVDGGELALLAGARDTLAHPRLVHVLVEIGERDLDAVSTVLGAVGFHETGRLLSRVPSPDRGRVGNVVFRRDPP